MPRFRLDFLPHYSPDLNPIERVWKVTRRLCLHNVYFPKLEFERVNPRLVSIGRRSPILFDYVAYSPSSSSDRNFFQTIKQYRLVATRYNKLAETFLLYLPRHPVLPSPHIMITNTTRRAPIHRGSSFKHISISQPGVDSEFWRANKKLELQPGRTTYKPSICR